MIYEWHRYAYALGRAAYLRQLEQIRLRTRQSCISAPVGALRLSCEDLESFENLNKNLIDLKIIQKNGLKKSLKPLLKLKNLNRLRIEFSNLEYLEEELKEIPISLKLTECETHFHSSTNKRGWSRIKLNYRKLNYENYSEFGYACVAD